MLSDDSEKSKKTGAVSIIDKLSMLTGVLALAFTGMFYCAGFWYQRANLQLMGLPVNIGEKDFAAVAAMGTMPIAFGISFITPLAIVYSILNHAFSKKYYKATKIIELINDFPNKVNNITISGMLLIFTFLLTFGVFCGYSLSMSRQYFAITHSKCNKNCYEYHTSEGVIIGNALYSSDGMMLVNTGDAIQSIDPKKVVLIKKQRSK